MATGMTRGPPTPRSFVAEVRVSGTEAGVADAMIEAGKVSVMVLGDR